MAGKLFRKSFHAFSRHFACWKCLADNLYWIAYIIYVLEHPVRKFIHKSRSCLSLPRWSISNIHFSFYFSKVCPDSTEEALASSNRWQSRETLDGKETQTNQIVRSVNCTKTEVSNTLITSSNSLQLLRSFQWFKTNSRVHTKKLVAASFLSYILSASM